MMLKHSIAFFVLFYFAFFSCFAQTQNKKKTYDNKKSEKKMKQAAKEQKRHEREKAAYQKRLKKEQEARERKKAEEEKDHSKREKEETAIAEKPKKTPKRIPKKDPKEIAKEGSEEVVTKKQAKRLQKERNLVEDDTTAIVSVNKKGKKIRTYWTNPYQRFYYDEEGLRTEDTTIAVYYIIRTDKRPSKRHKRITRELEFIEDTDGMIEGYYMSGELYFKGYSNMGELDYKFTSFYKNGKKKEEGLFNQGLYHLKNYWDEEGELIVEEGNGQLDEYFLDGSIKAEGRYRKGYKTGEWKYYYPGEESERAIIEHTEGRERILNYWTREGKQIIKDGFGKYVRTYSNGRTFESCRLNEGYFAGVYQCYFHNAILREKTPYEYGFKNGVSSTFYSNGSIKTRGRYEYDLKVGIWKDWFIDHKFNFFDYIKSQLSKSHQSKKEKTFVFKSQIWKTINLRQEKQYLDFGDYKMLQAYDRRGRHTLIQGEGYHEEYYGNGYKKEEFKISDGKKNGLYKLYYPDGSLYEEGYYVDDVKKPIAHNKDDGSSLLIGGEGACQYKYFNGKPKYRISYKNFIPNGKYEAFYTNGADRVVGEYTDGERSNVWTYYDREGNILKEERYYSKEEASNND